MSELHERAKAVFLEAVALPPAQRGAFAARTCAEDEALRREVESLLAALGVGILQEALQTISQQIFWLPGVLFDLGIDLAGGILGLLIWRLFGAKITGSRQAPD